jgi:zinc protease
LQHIDTIADLMNLYNFYLGDPNSFNYDLNRYTDLNTDELQYAANKFFKNNFVELQIVPKVDNANR